MEVTRNKPTSVVEGKIWKSYAYRKVYVKIHIKEAGSVGIGQVSRGR